VDLVQLHQPTAVQVVQVAVQVVTVHLQVELLIKVIQAVAQVTDLMAVRGQVTAQAVEAVRAQSVNLEVK
jgi:hypothetical protein